MANATPHIGIGDRPLDCDGKDELGIGDYAAALRDFVLECETPLTIGIQGDWGSGKTSLMNLMQPKSGAAVVWINTWKYAQLGDPQTLFLSVLSGIVRGIRGVTSAAAAKVTAGEALQKLARGVRFVGRAAAQHYGVDVDKLVAATTDDEAGPEGIAESLRRDLQVLVAAAAEELGRVVLFVDDLDRIPPVRAVQILEALKNFLDVPGLITVLACDYEVISRGLAERVGVAEADLGRSFFDKIIQVPFRMPMHAYRGQEYVGSLLARIGLRPTPEELDLVTEVLRTSVGLNPRALKRHVNTLLLLTKVASLTENLKEQIGDQRRPLILLGLTAMEARYGDVHGYLAQQFAGGDAAAAVASLLAGLVPSGEPWVAGWVEGDADARVWKPELSAFLEAMRGLVDVDGSGALDRGELDLLKEMVLLSRVSGVEVDRNPAPSRRTLPWSKPEFTSKLESSRAGEAQRQMVLRVLTLVETLEQEGRLAIDWGKGATLGAFNVKVRDASLLYVATSGNVNVTLGYWDRAFSLPTRLGLARELDAILGTNLVEPCAEQKDVYPRITAELLARDRELVGLERWLRRASKAADDPVE